MGVNCPACGELLKPVSPPSYIERREVRVYECTNCGAKYLIVFGKQPRIYQNMFVVCVDDGEQGGE